MIHCFRSKNFCLTVPKNFVGEPFCAVFQKISGIEEFMEKRGGGAKVFCRNLFVSQRRKLSQGHPLVFHCFWVSKNFRGNRGGGITTLRRKHFCLTVPKKCVGEHFYVSQNLWFRKNF